MMSVVLRFDSATGSDPELRKVSLDTVGVQSFLETELEGPVAYLLANEDLERFVKLLPGSLPFIDLGLQYRNGTRTMPFKQAFAQARMRFAAIRSNYKKAVRLKGGVAKLFEGMPVAETQYFYIGVPKEQWAALLGKLNCAPEEELEVRRRFIGKSAAAGDTRQRILLCAGEDCSVLITGPTGSGKEVAARLVHKFSARIGPFCTLNCAAIPDALFENELFGRVRGAYTGAVDARPGLFELADGGTLFLDEVAELSLEHQAKLLRVLEDGMVKRLGGVVTRRYDVRIIAATHKNLEDLVARGKFREDLYYRLCAYPIFTPELLDEDIETHVRHAWKKLGEGVDLPEDVVHAFRSRGWPGNVRQLERVVQRMTLEARGGIEPTPERVEIIVYEQERSRPAAAAAPVESEASYMERLTGATSEFEDQRDDYAAAGRALEAFLRQRAAVYSSRNDVETHTRSVAELAEELQRDWNGCPLAEVPHHCRVTVVVQTKKAARALVRETECTFESEPLRDRALVEEGDGDADRAGVPRESDFGAECCRIRVGGTDLITLAAEFSDLSEEARDLWIDVEVLTIFEDEWKAVRGAGYENAPQLREYRDFLREAQDRADRVRAAQDVAGDRTHLRSAAEMREELEILERTLACAPGDADIAARAAMFAGLLGDVATAALLVQEFSREFQGKVLMKVGRKMCARYSESSEAYKRGSELQETAATLLDSADDGRSYYCTMAANSGLSTLDDVQTELGWLPVPRSGQSDA